MRSPWIFLASAVLIAGCSSDTALQLNSVQEGISDWFKDETKRRGIQFVHVSGADGNYFMPEMMGGGVAVLDVDNDTDLDIYFVQSGHLQNDETNKTLGNQLYLNDGDGNFEIAESAGDAVTHLGYGIGVATGDYDQDGDVDLYVTQVGANVLLRNNGDSSFTDVTSVAGVGDLGWGTSAAFADFDADDDLDLFVANYINWTPGTELECFHWMSATREYCPPDAYSASAQDRLYENQGDGQFEDVTSTSGILNVLGNGLGVATADFNNDGLLDIFVANDLTTNHLWLNLGQMRFMEDAELWGGAADRHGKIKAGMGVMAKDFDHDHDEDLLVVNLVAQTDSYFRNEGTYFTDATADVGLTVSSQRYTRFGLIAADFNLDGAIDIFQANGAIARAVDPISRDPYAEPNVVYKGSPDLFFSEVLALPNVYTSRGAAVGDFDSDGALDLIVTNRDERPQLYMNQNSGNWVRLLCLDQEQRHVDGCKVQLSDGTRSYHLRSQTSGSYVSANSPWVHVGLSEEASALNVTIEWKKGEFESFSALEINQSHRLVRGSGTSG